MALMPMFCGLVAMACCREVGSRDSSKEKGRKYVFLFSKEVVVMRGSGEEGVKLFESL